MIGRKFQPDYGSGTEPTNFQSGAASIDPFTRALWGVWYLSQHYVSPEHVDTHAVV
jgi:hypothetical protein